MEEKNKGGRPKGSKNKPKPKKRGRKPIKKKTGEPKTFELVVKSKDNEKIAFPVKTMSPFFELNAKERVTAIVNALIKTDGMLSHAAQELNLSISSLRDMINRSPELIRIQQDLKCKLFDDIERIIYDKAKLGDLEYIRLILRYNKMADRGFVATPANTITVSSNRYQFTFESDTTNELELEWKPFEKEVLDSTGEDILDIEKIKDVDDKN